MIDQDVAEEVESVPAFVTEGTEEDDIEIAGEDVSQAVANSFEEWIEPAKDVTFEITKAIIDTYTPKDSNEWKTRSLKLYLKVDKGGVDGKGKYAGKMFFPRMIVTVNRDGYDFTINAQGKPTNWYVPKTGGAFGLYNEFLTALGFPNNPAPANNKPFRDSLVGRKVIANIDKKHRQVSDGGKYVNVPDEFENELSKFRAVKLMAAGTVADAEAAVA